MIERCDGGYSLRCTGCQKVTPLTEREVMDGMKLIARKEKLETAHRNCDPAGATRPSPRQARQRQIEVRSKYAAEQASRLA